jgi:thiamine biosynthesis lipoprotein
MTNQSTQSTRREFLQGKSAVDALEDASRALLPDEGAMLALPSGRSYLVEVGRRAMACQFEVFLNAGEHSHATEHAIDALDLIDQLEDQWSVYRHRSEVSRLNLVADQRAVSVESGLFRLLERSVELYRETDGAFDLTAGPLIQAWSALRRGGTAPTDDSIRALLQMVGSDKLLLDVETQSVSFARAGVTVNLGAIGKGYALDRATELLAERDVQNFMIHGGSSSMVARGNRMTGLDTVGWTVGIRHPMRADRRLVELQLVDRAVGTSGAGTQHFYYQGKRFGHVIDPRTGYPAEGVLSTTVIAPEATLADALSTAFYVLGLERTQAYCASHPDIAVLMTTASRRAGDVELHAINCDELQWRRLGSDDE